MKILALSGSLRRESTNTRLLHAAARVAPSGVEVEVFDGVASLPYFSPDLDDADVPEIVTAWRAEVAAADAVLICCPEYAGAIPGAFKNALDWLVGCMAMYDKPVAILNASPASLHVEASLRLVLAFLTARLVDAASIVLPLRGSRRDAAQMAAEPALAQPLRAALEALVTAAGADLPVRR